LQFKVHKFHHTVFARQKVMLII